jgi:Putative prokaryotic signal transducing protein
VNLVTIFKGWNLNEAELVRSRLEAAGFHPTMVNEYAANMFGGSNNVLSPVSVQVPDNEADDVREFLETPNAPAE